MAVEIDYYDFLGVPRDADTDAIEDAVKKGMREWRKRTEASDLSVRQEAEVKVKQIEDARRTLLDAAKRAKYDQDLAGGVKQSSRPAPTASSSGVSWLEQAEGFLAVGDYHSAAYAAREATHVEVPNAKTWWVRSRANAGLGLWQDALYEARQATTMEDNNAEYHFNLGLVHEQMNSYNEAINSYRRAGTCDPSNPMYELAVGGVYASNGRYAEALPIIEAVYKKHPKDETANYYLGLVLIDLAENVPASKDKDGYIVKSDEEIHKMRAYAERAKSLNIVDPETRKAADHILAYLDEMEQKVFRPPWSLVLSGAALGADMGVGAAVIGGCCTITIFFLPVILLFAGFGSLGENPGAGFLMILVGAALCWLWWTLMYVPKWKHNKRGL
jgi:tetratricopeptide (TPR) repeat protein